MALKLNDLIVTDVWDVTCFSIDTGKVLFSLLNCNDTTFDAPSTETEITGGKSSKVLAVVSSERKAILTVNSATFDLNLLGLQAGDDEIYGENVIVPTSEEIQIPDSTAYTVSLKRTPDVDSFVSVMLGDGTALVDSETVGADTFTITGKVITFDASHKGKIGKVFYSFSATEAVDIQIDTKAPIKYCSVRAEATFQNNCDGRNYLGYIIMDRASISKPINLATTKSSADNAIQNVTFNAISACGNTKIARIVIYDPEADIA